MLKLRYDGKWDWIEGDNRQWTIVSSYMVNGQDRKGSSFLKTGLHEMGILKGAI